MRSNEVEWTKQRKSSADLTSPRESRYLRTLADSRALVAEALTSQRAVVIGSSFIGLEYERTIAARA